MSMAGVAASVWCVPIAATRQELDQGAGWLSPGERERAERFADRRAAARFTAARAALRQLLGDRLGSAPAAIEIVEEATGRPRLSHSTLRFSVSHSGDMALVALADHGRIGVDIEALRPLPAAVAIARAVQDAALAARLEGLSPAERSHAFLAAWTKREALAKASGHALDRSLTPSPGRARDGLRIVPIDLPAGYVGALASDSPLAPRVLDFDPTALAGVGPGRPRTPGAAVASSEMAP